MNLMKSLKTWSRNNLSKFYLEIKPFEIEKELLCDQCNTCYANYEGRCKDNDCQYHKFMCEECVEFLIMEFTT